MFALYKIITTLIAYIHSFNCRGFVTVLNSSCIYLSRLLKHAEKQLDATYNISQIKVKSPSGSI